MTEELGALILMLTPRPLQFMRTSRSTPLHHRDSKAHIRVRFYFRPNEKGAQGTHLMLTGSKFSRETDKSDQLINSISLDIASAVANITCIEGVLIKGGIKCVYMKFA